MKYLNDLKPYGALPNNIQMEHLKIAKKAFIHFNMSTIADKEWSDGDEDIRDFNPKNVDCRDWVRKIKSAGFEMIILTAKHHDGFCLWPSAYTSRTIQGTPYKDGKGDIVKEFTDACLEYGVKAGIYISPYDRNAPDWGTEKYNDYFVNQLTELLTNYGEIHEVWWDGAGSQNAPYDWGRWAFTVRNLQPKAGIFGALGAAPYVDFRWVGNESGFAGDPCYATVDEEIVFVEDTSILNSGMLNGERFIPAEVDMSSRPGWFYHKEQDDEVKSVEKMVKIWFSSIGRGCMMLMNFPPDKDGVMPDKDILNAVRANDYINRMLSVNLAIDGVAESKDERCESYNAQNILVNNSNCFFAAKDDTKNVVININLPEKRLFNTFTISEKIELGIRVSGYRISAYTEDGWTVIKDKKSIGYMWAEYFEPVCSDQIKIEIYDFVAPPVIESFGLHYLEINPFKEDKVVNSNKNLAAGTNANVVYNANSIEVMFGGIYDFNTVVLNRINAYEYKIEAFNGSNYYEIYRGNNPEESEVIKLDNTVEGSYQMRISVSTTVSKDSSIEVYNL